MAWAQSTARLNRFLQARVRLGQRRGTDAERLLRGVVEVRQRTLPPGSWRIGQAQSALATARLGALDAAESDQACREWLVAFPLPFAISSMTVLPVVPRGIVPLSATPVIQETAMRTIRAILCAFIAGTAVLVPFGLISAQGQSGNAAKGPTTTIANVPLPVTITNTPVPVSGQVAISGTPTVRVAPARNPYGYNRADFASQPVKAFMGVNSAISTGRTVALTASVWGSDSGAVDCYVSGEIY